MTETSIRAFEMRDWEDVAELFMAPNCRWGTLQMPFQSKDDIKRKLENPPEGMHRLVAEHGDSGRVVGMLGLHPLRGRRAHVGYIGMFVHDDHQNQGIGSRLMETVVDLADNWLNLKRLELTVYTDNERAVHLYEKFGFVHEGIHLAYGYRDGEYVDTHAMARVRI